MGKKMISFDLALPAESKELPVILMETRGYKRSQILYCFQQLQEMGLGVFDRGSQGRGKIGKFIPNEKCPNKMDIEFELKKKGRPKKTRERMDD